MVAQTFISFAPYFKMYSAYINSYVSAQVSFYYLFI